MFLYIQAKQHQAYLYITTDYNTISFYTFYNNLLGFAEDYDPGIVYYRNEIHFPEESDPKLLTEQYNPKSYLKKTIHFLKNMILLQEYDPLLP